MGGRGNWVRRSRPRRRVTVALIDDQALAAVLRGERSAPLAGRDLATTGCWYVRLCQAVLSVSERPGVLSRPFEELPEAHRRRAVDALDAPLRSGTDGTAALSPSPPVTPHPLCAAVLWWSGPASIR